MQIIEVTQGSPEWLAHRAKCWNASDAPAMMGVSPYKTRAEFLRECATGIVPEVDAATQRRFDDGHRFEAMARPLAERILGEDLYPVSGTHDTLIIGGRPVAASFDGLTMGEEVVFEHKKLNADLRAAFDQMRTDLDGGDLFGNGVLSPLYTIQMEQQMLVSGAQVVLFVASEWADDGTLIEERHCRYWSDPDLRAKILAGWKQFAADLAVWKPEPAPAEMPKPEAVMTLPALYIEAHGEITASNMKEYGAALATRLAQIRSIQLVTDQDFSNAKESAKMLRESIDAARQAKEAMLAKTLTVGEAARMIDTWCEDMRLTALQLEKDVEREDRNKKTAMVLATKEKFEAYVATQAKRIEPVRLGWPMPAFADALKNKRNFASMQDALDTMLSNAKIAASATADRVQANREQLRPQNGTPGEDWISLFPDFDQVCTKPMDDFHNLVTARVTKELSRRKAEEERIRAEEQAKAEADARAKLAAEQAAQAVAAPAPVQAPASAPIAAPPPVQQAANVVQMRHTDSATEVLLAGNGVRFIRPAAPPVDDGQRIKLGEIQDLIAPLSITAKGLEQFNIRPTGREGSSQLYRRADLPLIRTALIAHLNKAFDTAPMAA